MSGRLRAVVSPFRMTSEPLPVAALPLLAAFAVLPLLLAAGCAETGQDASTASEQETGVLTPAEPEEAAAPAEVAEMPELVEAPELAEVPEGVEAPGAPPHEAVYLTSETTASMNLPFSDAVRVGHLLFLSGQIGNIPGTTDLAPGGIQGEARQTMENIRTVLEANGSSMDRVIKATVMLADISEWPAFNEVYVTYFPGDKPARSAFAGSGLAFGARCEVEVIATVGE